MTDSNLTADAATDSTRCPSTDAETDDPLLTVESLQRRFGDVTVLSDVSFVLERGTVTCVVGPNGSGKTTLLRVVAGLLAPSGGTVDLATERDHAVGYLPQNPAFRPQFTPAETLDFYADLAGVAIDPREVLAGVGLEGVADRRVGALSGGMVRLFGMAQATVGDPPLLVLDEPSSGLDPTMTDHVRTVIRNLAGEETAVLLATHDLATVEAVADGVLVLDGGGVAARGSPGELREETGAETLTRAVSGCIAGGSGELTVRAGRREGGA